MSDEPALSQTARYEELLELGRGGMGSAHLARALGAGNFERLVVVKRMLPHLLQQPEAIARFLAEAKVAAQLHHTNVVGVHHAGRDDSGYFIVYDYVEGAALDELEDWAAFKCEDLPPPIILRIILDAAWGLHAAHTAKGGDGTPLEILHRDISPQNLLVGRDGTTRVLDFGIAKSALATFSTDQNFLVGKLPYLPPEYLTREPVGPRFDVYSLGVTLWIMLARRMPWGDSSEGQLVMEITQRGVPPLSSVGVTVAPALEALVVRACALDPAQRFQSAAEMADELERLGRDTGWLASHREVSMLVERFCGEDLDQRRRRLRDQPTTAAAPVAVSALSAGDGWASAPLDSSALSDLPTEHVMERPPAQRQPTAEPPTQRRGYGGVTDGSATLESLYSPQRSRSRAGLLAVIASLALAGGAVAWGLSTQAQGTPQTGSSPRPTESASDVAPVKASLSDQPTPPAPPSSASAAASADPTAAPSPAPRSAPSPDIPRPTAAPAPRPAPASGIRKSNPYRK